MRARYGVGTVAQHRSAGRIVSDVNASVQATFCATLADEWVEQGLRHAVVAPGSRSTPMALALAERPELSLHVAHDERTAAFMALGIGLVSARPAAVLCTSGTAATHLHAAVVEAHLSGVPMLVLTADRPPELHDVGAAQTIDQTRLYGSAPRWFHDPGVPDVAARAGWRSLAERAWASCLGADPGPVHLNLPFREPLVGEVLELPPRGPGVATIRGVGALPSDLDVLVAGLDAQRGVIVAGAGCAEAVDDVAALATATGWPVLADARSGCRSLDASVSTYDALLRHTDFASAHTPEVVVRLGEAPASKVLAQWIAGSPARVIQVTGRPVVLDPDHRVSARIVGPIGATCRAMAAALRGASGTPWLARWQSAEASAARVLDDWAGRGVLDEPTVAHTCLRALPAGASLVVSSSMPIRDVEWYGGRVSSVDVLSNRGANGIDGVVATAIGVSVAAARTVGVLVGDVAFLHDSSSLVGLARRGADVRIVVVDNDGGGIFSFLPQASSLPTERFEQLFGTPHGTDIEMLARAHGLPARTVSTVDDLRVELSTPGPRVVRVVSERAGNVATHDALHRAVHAAL